MTVTIQPVFDRARWDAFVSAQPSGHYMQSYAWGELQQHLGWQTLYCVLERDGVIRATALLLHRTVPLLNRDVYYAPRGPVAAANDRDALEEICRGIGDAMRKKGVFVRFDPYWTEAESAAFDHEGLGLKHVPRDWSSWNAPRFVFWLDLAGDEATLMKRLTATCRNEVRRGYKNGVVFETGTANDLDAFHHMMTLMGNHKGIAYHDTSYYHRLFEILNRSANVQLFLGRFEGEIVTSGISVAYGRKAWLLYAASAPAHYKLRANRTLQWEMIKWAQALGCERYDFRGTATNDPPNPKDPGYGVYEFKKSFGPEFTRLAGYYDLVDRDLSYRFLRFSEDRLLPYVYRIRTLLA